MIGNFSYSIIIRTIGNTGDKYRQMLECINAQSIKPEEVIVVIPYEYDLDYSLGYERIVRSEKGMVTQRAIGIAEANSEYVLVVDDDLIFPRDFVEKMMSYLLSQQLDCVLAFGNWSGITDRVDDNDREKFNLKKKIISKFFEYRRAFTGQHFVSNKKSKYFDVVTVTAGHRTFESSPNGLCSAGCFQCFYMKTDKAKAVKFDEERWLEQGSLSRYAAYDDMCFFYKSFLQGSKIVYTDTTSYRHLDAAAGRRAKGKLHARQIRLYSIARNRTIFWYKFLWLRSETLGRRIQVLFGGIYAFVNYTFYNLLVNLYPPYWKAISAMWRGYRDAMIIIHKIDE